MLAEAGPEAKRSGRRGSFPILVALVSVAAGVVAGSTPSYGASSAASGPEHRTFTGAGGSREYDVYRPPGGGAGRPLVVYLHGCTETADEAAETTGFPELAALRGFVVVFPEQERGANSLRCWNWFRESDQSRDTGEAAIIAGIARTVLSEEGADARRVYVAGMSAGASMAVVMGVTHPDLFAAVAMVAGCEFRGLPCVLSPSGLAPEISARYAYEAMGTHARPVPAFVVQGDADRVVPPANAELVVGQWLETADLAVDGQDDGPSPSEPSVEHREASPGGHAYEVATWNGPDGVPLVERWLVAGLAHEYPRAPDATAGAWRFFLDHPRT